MNRFRKIIAQAGEELSTWDKIKEEINAANYPTEYKSELMRILGPGVDPAKANQVVNEALQKIEDYDKKYKSVERFYEDNMPDSFTGYLNGMKQKYNVNYWIAASFFNDAWNLYKTKFSSVEGFSILFHKLIDTYKANLPMALSQLKSLLEKLPSALGRVSNEKDFIKLVVDLAENPDDENVNKMFEKFIINEFIRDLILNKTDEKLMAANVVDSKNLIKEIGRVDDVTEQQASMQELYMAYNSYIDKTFDQIVTDFNVLIEMKKKIYSDLTNDIINKGLDNEDMKYIRDALYRAIRTYEIGKVLSPSTSPPSAPPEAGNK